MIYPLRTIGPDANGAFRSYLLDYNVIKLVTLTRIRMDIILDLLIHGRLERMVERSIFDWTQVHDLVTEKKLRFPISFSFFTS